MIEMNRRGSEGFTVTEFLEGLLFEVDGDGEGLWSIVPTGRSGFGFEGPELTEFVRLSVMHMLEAGAVPALHRPLTEPLEWIEQTQYGTTKDQIADAVVAEWLAKGGGDPPWDDLWFVTRKVVETEVRE